MRPVFYIATVALIPLGDFVLHDSAWILAGMFALCGSIGALYNIAMHLAYWTQPVYQLWIVRVLFIVPIYAMISFVSIHEASLGLYLEIVRDCYEAFVIYCFLLWILNVIGGEEACAVSISQRMNMRHPCPLCCLPPLRLNASFLRMCKQLTLQFVIMKPVMATISFLLLVIGGESLYYNSVWQLIMLSTYNVSYTLALYGLFLFYIATKDEMNSVSPVKKFLAVKSVVFLTYWQALLIPVLFGSKYSDKTNDFILCLEMVFFAFLHYRAFPWYEFKHKQLQVDKIRYGYTNFGGLEDIAQFRSPSNSPRGNGGLGKGHKQKTLKDDFEYQRMSVGGEEQTPHSKLAVLSNEEISFKLWCSALWQVINVMDVCDDAKKNFVTPTLSPVEAERDAFDDHDDEYKPTEENENEQQVENENLDEQPQLPDKQAMLNALLLEEHNKTQRQAQHADEIELKDLQ